LSLVRFPVRRPVGLPVRSVLGGVFAFSPDQVSSTQAFYDPSDLTSLYQSRTGGANVSADGQTVGIMLDKSQMGGKTAAAFIAGAAEVVAPLDFETGWAYSGAIVTPTSSNSYTAAGLANYYKEVLTTGVTYVLTITATFTSSSLILYNNISGTDTITSLSSGVSKTVIFTAVNANFNIRPGSAGDVTINNISIKALPGHHALAPSDAARPLYKTAANTGKAGYAAAMAAQPELVTNGTFDTDTDWTKGTGWTISGGVATHDAVASGFLNPITPILEENKTYLISWSVVGTSGLSLRTGTTSTVVVSDMHAVSSAVVTVKGGTALAVYAHAGSMAGPVSIDNVSVKEVPAAYLHRYVDYDGVDDVLNATLPNLGSTASVWYMKQDGTAVYAANQSISGAYALPAVDMRGLIIVDGPISASDQTKLATYYA